MSSFVGVFEQDLGECVSSFDFSPMGDFFAVGLINEQVLVWKYKNEAELKVQLNLQYQWDGHSMGVVDVKFNPEGTRLAVSSLDSIIRTWNVDEGKKISEAKCSQMANWKIAFLVDGKQLVTSGENGHVLVVDTENGQIIKSIESAGIFSTAIAVSPPAQDPGKNKFVAIGNHAGGVFLFDVQQDYKRFPLEYHQKIVRSLAFTRDCQKLVTGSDDQLINVFDLKQMKPMIQFPGHKGNINCVDVSPIDDKLFLTSSYDKTIKLWDINSKNCVDTITLTDNVWAAKFSNDGKIIGAACEDGKVSLSRRK